MTKRDEDEIKWVADAKPFRIIDVADYAYPVVLLTTSQVDRIAEAVLERLMASSLDVVLGDRIRDRIRQRDNEEVERELAAEHRRYADGFGHE